MTRSTLLSLSVIPVLLLTGCPDKPRVEPTPAASSAPAAPSAAPPPTSSSAPVVEAPPPPPPLPLPPDKGSVAPTPVEWKKAPKVEIAHAEPLGCEARMLREWVRVECREHPWTDLPLRAKVTRDDGAENRIFARRLAERVIVIVAVRKGTDAEAELTWRTPGWGKRRLNARFGQDDARPVVAFDRGAPSVEESPIAKGQVPGEKPRVGRMLPVPAGARKGGEPVTAFLLDQTEVTFWAWEGCVQADACPEPSGRQGCARSTKGVDPLRPVHCVTWDEARTYCDWAGKRLPTVEEWRYAFHGSDGRTYPWGDTADVDNVCDYQEHQWVEHDGKRRLLDLGCKVGSHPGGAGPFGHHDLLSNVEEWTSGEEEGGKVALGGAFGTVSGVLNWQEYWAGLMRMQKESHPADARMTYVGFRCARSR